MGKYILQLNRSENKDLTIEIEAEGLISVLLREKNGTITNVPSVPEYETNEAGNKCTYDESRKLHSFNDQPAIISPNGTQAWFKNGLRHRENDLPALIYSDGHQVWFKNGLKHRDNDLPALIYSDGHEEYWINGKNIDKPQSTPQSTVPDYETNYAGEKHTKNKEGQFHSFNDQPSLICTNGAKFWHQNGLRHRDNDLPAIIWSNGDEEYWINGKRVYKLQSLKPTVPEYKTGKSGQKYTNNEDDLYHSFNDQPAVIYPDGTQYWYRNGLLHRDNKKPAIIYSDGAKEYWVEGSMTKAAKKPKPTARKPKK